MKGLQLSRGGARMTAFGIFDSVETGKKMSTKENLLDDDSVGRLQIALTEEAKRELIQCLQDHFSTESIIEQQTVADPEPRRVSVSNQELEPPSVVNESRDEEEQDSVSFDTTESLFGDSPRDLTDPFDAKPNESSSVDSSSISQMRIQLAVLTSQMNALQTKYKSIKRKMSGYNKPKATVRQNEDDVGETIHFIYNGWAGRVKMQPHKMLTLDDIRAGFEPIPPHLNDKYSEESQKKKHLELVTYGTSTAWLPRDATLESKNQQNAVNQSKDVQSSLLDIFDFQQTTLCQKSKWYLAIGKLFAPGCSDEGANMIISCTKCRCSCCT